MKPEFPTLTTPPIATWIVPPWDPGFMAEVPWDRGDWHGSIVALDGCSDADVHAGDVARVCAYTMIGLWDDVSAGLAILHDRRFVGWESHLDVSGSGFHADAIGGGADIWFARDPDLILRRIAERERDRLTWSTAADEVPELEVVRDAWIERSLTLDQVVDLTCETWGIGSVTRGRETLLCRMRWLVNAWTAIEVARKALGVEASS